MKKLLILVIAVATFSLIPVHSAKADHDSYRRLVGYTSCGQPIYAVYQICGYDHCGRPIGRWVTQYPSSNYESRDFRSPYCPDYSRHCEPSRPSWGFSIRF